MNHKKHHQPIRVEKINRSAEEINYLLSTIQDKIDKSEFPNYHVPFSALTPEQKAELRGPQGNSGIIGDINNIAIEAVNDLNGGESTPGKLRVLSAEQGKVLNLVAQTNKQNITNLTLVVGEIIELMKEYQFKDMGEFHLEEDVNQHLFMTPDIGFFSFIIDSEKTARTSFSFVKHISLSQIGATEYLALRNGTELGWLAVDTGASDSVDFIATPHPYSLATILAQQKNILEQHIDSNNKHISAIDRNLSDLERTVTANKNELDEDVVNLLEDVETVAAKVQTINVEVGHHNDDISHLQGDVRNNTNNITALGSRIDALGSVYNIQGTKPSLAQLLAITSAKKGDVYSIDSEFYLAGKFYPASTNVVCVTAFTSASDNKASCWDPLGGTFNASLYLEKSKAAVVNPSDLTESLERIEDITYTEKGKEFVSGSALGSVLPFKLISKTKLDNGSTAWYRLALNFPTGSSNAAHQLLLQYAETRTIPTEADWKTINYINNISLSSLLSRSDVANNLTTTASGKVLDARQGKVLADAIAFKQDILASGENIKTINNQSILGEGNITIEGGSANVGITGTLNVTDLNSIAAAQDLITKPYGVAFYLITDSNGKLPSKNQEAVQISAGVEKLLSFRSPNTAVNNILAQVSIDNFKPRGFNVGDIIALSRVPVSIDALVEYLGLSSAIATALKLLGLSEIEIYQYKIWTTNDAKWSNFQNKDGSVVPTGVKGLMSVWDKEQVDKVPRLEANDLSTKYGYGTNFDDCLTTGVCAYSPATINGVTENFTLIVQASSTVDSGGFYSIIQTAYGRTGSVYNRVFKRMIFYNPTTGAKEPHAWVEITENNKSTKYFTTNCAPDAIFSALDGAKVNGFAEVSSETEDATRGYTFKGYFNFVPTDGSPYYMGVGMITYNDTNLSEPAIMIAHLYNPTQIIGATRIADLEARINSLGIIDKGTLNEAQIRGLCESSEIGIFTYIDSSDGGKYTLIKPFVPQGPYNFLVIKNNVDTFSTLSLVVRGGDKAGHGGYAQLADDTVTAISNNPVSSKAVYNAIYSVLNTEV